MGQVPSVTNEPVALASKTAQIARAAVLLIGDGGLASTLATVLSDRAKHSSSVDFRQWSRHSSSSFENVFTEFDPTHVWLAISDRALESFAAEHKTFLQGRRVVHFSGALPSFSFVHAAHPLSTFTKATAVLNACRFSQVPFILDLNGPALSDLLPGFENRAYRIDPRQRAYYHALCSIAGNFTVLLWETIAFRFEKELGIPQNALDTYRSAIFENLSKSTGESVLTGPLTRGDSETLQKHRAALLEKYEIPLLKIYDGFVDLYQNKEQA
jgi:hypothetical protein